jgi:hypothetical protein
MSGPFDSTEEVIERVRNAAGVVIAVNESRIWIERLNLRRA